MKRLQEAKQNNKGFSLVELIIVIAIMAVLIGILAPQFIKYVDKSRKSADLDNVDEIITAIQVGASDPDLGVSVAGAKIEFTTGTAGGTLTDNSKKEIQACLDNAKVDLSNIKIQSESSWGNKVTINVEADGSCWVDTATANSDMEKKYPQKSATP